MDDRFRLTWAGGGSDYQRMGKMSPERRERERKLALKALDDAALRSRQTSSPYLSIMKHEAPSSVSIREACKILCTERTQLRRWLKEGRLKGFRLPGAGDAPGHETGRIRVLWSSLMEFMKPRAL